MKALKGLCRHELSFFLRPWASVWLASWVFSCAAVTLLHGQLFDGQQVQLRPFFSYIPWLGAVFLPILGVHLWARESRLGTLVWMLSLPHSTLRCVLVKFAAAWLLMTCALLLTWPLAVSLMYLGTPDLGIIFSSYTGALGYLSVQLALCYLASCCSSRPLYAYALGFGLCFLHNLPACDLLNDWLPHSFSSSYFADISRLSSSYHFLGFLRGVIDSRDLFYWVSMVVSLLGISYAILITRRSISSSSWWHPESRTIYGLGFFMLLFGFILLATTQTHKRWDLTDEKLYTLSDGSRAIVEKLPAAVHVNFYFSRSHAQLETSLRNYGQRIEELLREFAALAPDRFSYKMIDPQQHADLELQARLHGLTGIASADGETLYFGAVYRMGQEELSLPYFDPQKEDQLEYDLVAALVKIAQKTKPVLGILSSLPLLRVQGTGFTRDWAIVKELRNLYQVVEVSSQANLIPPEIRTLLVVHPKNIDEKTEYALDQFVMGGGNLLVAVDPFCRSELFTNNNQQNPPSQLASNLPLLFKAWGLEYDSQKIVGDLDRRTPLQSAYQNIDYPFYISLQVEDFNASHLISNRISQMVLAEAGWFSNFGKNALHWTVLAQTSAQSGTVPTQMANYMEPSNLTTQIKVDDKKRVLAGVLFGRFNSAFAAPPPGSDNKRHISESAHDNAVILLADVDFLADHHAVEKIQSQSQMILKPKNDNHSFFLRAVEFAGGNKDLIGVRNSRRLPRPFTRLQKLQQEAQLRLQAQADKLGTLLHEVEEQLHGELIAADDYKLVNLEHEQKLKTLREKEAHLRIELRQLRRSMVADSKHLRQQLIYWNLLGEPLLLAGVWGVFIIYRRRSRPAPRRSVNI